jgi:hypothetical protein
MFLMQLKDKAGDGGKVELGVLELAGDNLCYYELPSSENEETAAIAASNGVTFDERGHIAKYESREGLLIFFRETAALAGNECKMLARGKTP